MCLCATLIIIGYHGNGNQKKPSEVQRPLPPKLEEDEPLMEVPKMEVRGVAVSFCETQVAGRIQYGLRFDVTCWVGATAETTEGKVALSFSEELEALLGTNGTAAVSLSPFHEDGVVTRTIELFSPRISAQRDLPQQLEFSVNGYWDGQLVLRQEMCCNRMEIDFLKREG